MHWPKTFLLILVTITFAASFPTSTNDITIASFNLHGYSGSAKYLKDCIQKHGGIWMIQEHWLSEQQIPKLQQLDAQFVARSGMEDAISKGIYPGRPFGGVGICWSPDLNNLVSPVTNFKHKRVTAVELNARDRKILLICAYMPFFNRQKRVECMTDTADAISFIELLIEEHPQHLVVIGGRSQYRIEG